MILQGENDESACGPAPRPCQSLNPRHADKRSMPCQLAGTADLPPRRASGRKLLLQQLRGEAKADRSSAARRRTRANEGSGILLAPLPSLVRSLASQRYALTLSPLCRIPPPVLRLHRHHARFFSRIIYASIFAVHRGVGVVGSPFAFYLGGARPPRPGPPPSSCLPPLSLPSPFARVSSPRIVWSYGCACGCFGR